MRRVLRSKRQLAASTHFDEKAPPTDRGELHVGGVAVFTRPFSGLYWAKHSQFREVSYIEKMLAGLVRHGIRPTLAQATCRQAEVAFSPPFHNGSELISPKAGRLSLGTSMVTVAGSRKCDMK